MLQPSPGKRSADSLASEFRVWCRHWLQSQAYNKLPPERLRIPDRLPVRHPLHFKALSSTLGILDKGGLMKQPLENRGSVQKRGAPKAASIRSKPHQDSRSLPRLECLIPVSI